ncbi:antitoxin Xre/MbcA/ParS toxin-binding domain-containing protein [Pseudomonas syringae]|uniref:antitoxin Xre/MbcA/ParS toxin-binding domain-containing protein n=1 Tax=Pseudomonas syringae TaxID=317 RepID=UPI003F74D667
MNGYRILPIRLRPLEGFWSIEYRYFALGRELVLNEAARVLGTRKAADLWLVHPARGLNYQPPCSLLLTSKGCQQVLNLLAQIEYGVYI